MKSKKNDVARNVYLLRQAIRM